MTGTSVRPADRGDRLDQFVEAERLQDDERSMPRPSGYGLDLFADHLGASSRPGGDRGRDRQYHPDLALALVLGRAGNPDPGLADLPDLVGEAVVAEARAGSRRTCWSG